MCVSFFTLLQIPCTQNKPEHLLYNVHMDEIQEIKNRLSIVDVIMPYVTLKKTGKSYKGNCPFHSEKSPSFIVTPELGIYKCFGCGEAGDIFNFVEKKEGIEFAEALHMLADKAGVVISEKRGENTKPIFEANKLAEKFYRFSLLKTVEGKKALEYLTKERQLTLENIERFGIGYSPNSWDQTYTTLTKKGIKITDLELAGLVIKKNNGYYDRFRGRVMFPFYDITGKVLGFSARSLDKNDGAKYINSPETKIFTKGQTLYGLFTNKKGIRDNDKALIVEGQMDVISTNKAGFNYAVAPGGTALTKEQLELIKRFTNNIILSFDSDVAGINALKKSIKLAEGLDINIKVLNLENYHDPDDAIKSSIKKFETMIDTSTDAYSYLINSYLKENIDSPTKRKQTAKEVTEIISTISDPINRDYYLTQLSEVLGVTKSNIRLTRSTQNNPTPKQIEIKGTNEEVIISILINYPNFITKYEKEIKKASIEVKISDKELKEKITMLRIGQVQDDAENELTKRLSAIITKQLEKDLKEVSKTGNTENINKIVSEIKKIKKM
jgi:DNA primase